MTGLRWYGGKGTSAARIVDMMPPHTRYLEPFGGGLSVLSAKPRVELETVNDLNDRVVNLYCVARDMPDELIRAVHLTPNARREVEIAADVSPDPVEDARRMVVCCYQSRRMGGMEPSGWRSSYGVGRVPGSMAMMPARNAVQRVCDRLAGVQVECKDAREVTAQYAHREVLVYVDPPYSSGERTDTATYSAESWGVDEHNEYVEQLLSLDAMVMVSGYAGGPYDRLASEGWRVVSWESYTSRSREKGDTRTERLWINDAASAEAMPLFASVADDDANP